MATKPEGGLPTSKTDDLMKFESLYHDAILLVLDFLDIVSQKAFLIAYTKLLETECIERVKKHIYKSKIALLMEMLKAKKVDQQKIPIHIIRENIDWEWDFGLLTSRNDVGDLIINFPDKGWNWGAISFHNFTKTGILSMIRELPVDKLIQIRNIGSFSELMTDDDVPFISICVALQAWWHWSKLSENISVNVIIDYIHLPWKFADITKRFTKEQLIILLETDIANSLDLYYIQTIYPELITRYLDLKWFWISMDLRQVPFSFVLANPEKNWNWSLLSKTVSYEDYCHNIKHSKWVLSSIFLNENISDEHIIYHRKAKGWNFRKQSGLALIKRKKVMFAIKNYAWDFARLSETEGIGEHTDLLETFINKEWVFYKIHPPLWFALKYSKKRWNWSKYTVKIETATKYPDIRFGNIIF